MGRGPGDTRGSGRCWGSPVQACPEEACSAPRAAWRKRSRWVQIPQAPGGSLLPPFPCKPWSSTVGPIIKACCPLAKKCKHWSFLPDPQSWVFPPVYLWTHWKAIYFCPTNTFLSFPGPCHRHLRPAPCQPSSELPEAPLSVLPGAWPHAPPLFFSLIFIWGKICFPGGSDGKKVYLQCRRPGSDPWGGKIPWRREWQPTPVFWLGESHGQRSLVGHSPWGCRVGRDWATNTTQNIEFIILATLSTQLYGIKCFYIVMQPSPLSVSGTLVILQNWNSVLSKKESALLLPTSPWQPPFHFFTFCEFDHSRNLV